MAKRCFIPREVLDFLIAWSCPSFNQVPCWIRRAAVFDLALQGIMNHILLSAHVIDEGRASIKRADEVAVGCVAS